MAHAQFPVSFTLSVAVLCSVHDQDVRLWKIRCLCLISQAAALHLTQSERLAAVSAIDGSA